MGKLKLILAALVVLVTGVGFARYSMLTEPMRKFLTGTPLSEFKLPDRVARSLRQAGVSYIDDIKDPVFKNAIEQEIATNNDLTAAAQ